MMLGVTSFAAAQQRPCDVVDGVRSGDCGAAEAPEGDPLARYLFPPELVMAHQQAINLTDRQRSAIQDAIKEAQGKFLDVQFKMSAEAEKLQRLIQGTAVDEAKVLEQIDRVLTLERDVKRAQLTVMIRIKNQLTEQQQAMLGQLRKQNP
jgi:hypothetical protein